MGVSQIPFKSLPQSTSGAARHGSLGVDCCLQVGEPGRVRDSVLAICRSPPSPSVASSLEYLSALSGGAEASGAGFSPSTLRKQGNRPDLKKVLERKLRRRVKAAAMARDLPRGTLN